MTDTGSGYDVDISGGSGNVVGDYARVVQIFLNGPAPLATRVRTREFGTLVRERTRMFVGREFVFDAIREAFDDEGFRSGYVMLRGEPGIGKTAIVAQLVKDFACVHHFNIAPLGIRSAEAFLANVCAQLILRYGLDYASLPPEATKDGGFLTGLLEEIAAVPANLPVVVAVDALDESEEAGPATGANRLFLPPYLPDRVYFVVSTRDGADSGLHVEARRDIDIHDDDARNVDDVRTYVRQYVDTNRERMAPRIEQWAIPEDEFVAVLTQKSAGNFMYLVHVLRDIRDGVLNSSTVDDVRKLPRGLRDYYDRHWADMRDPDRERFRRYQEPVVCLLATAREPVSAQQLLDWTRNYWQQQGWNPLGLSPVDVDDVTEAWREFLNSEEFDDGVKYRVYHASFQDFLADRVGLTRYHDTIGRTALAKIPGFLDRDGE